MQTADNEAEIAKQRAEGMVKIKKQIREDAAITAKQRAEDMAKIVKQKNEDAAKTAKQRAEDMAIIAKKTEEDMVKIVKQKNEDAAKTAKQRAEDMAIIAKKTAEDEANAKKLVIEWQIKANQIVLKTEEKKLEVSQHEVVRLSRIESILKKMENYSSEQRDMVLGVQHANKKYTRQAENIPQRIPNY